MQLNGEVLKESEGERGTIDGLDLLVDEEHRHSREELVGAERLDKADEEADATVSRYMAGRVGEDVEELLEVCGKGSRGLATRSSDTFATKGLTRNESVAAA